MQRSLKSILILTIIALVVVSILAVALLASHRYASSQEELLAAQAANLGRTLSAESTDLVLTNDLVGLQKRLESYKQTNPKLSYLFVQQEDRVLAAVFEGSQDNAVPTDLIQANQPRDEHTENLEKILSKDGEKYLDVAMPIYEGRAGVLRLGFSQEHLSLQVAQLWQEILLVTLAILVPVLVVAMVIINRITRPLANLAQAAGKVEPGETMEVKDCEVRGQKEIQVLAEAFKHMTDRIQDYTRRLKEQANELKNAHRKMQTTCEVSRGISALRDLEEIGEYLMRRLKKIIYCPQNMILVIGPKQESLFVISDKGVSSVYDPDLTSFIEARLQCIEDREWVEKDLFSSLPLPSNLSLGESQMVVPFYYEDTLCGAMVSACSSKCKCDPDTMELISLVLSHASGTIKRAVLYQEEVSRLENQVSQVSGFEGMISRDPKMQTVFKLIEDVAPTDATVLIYGESGTGKELVAQAIHNQSHRREFPFVVINCSAYPSTLLESELFGHEKGAFTGATHHRPGRFEQAKGGTVFLDEIAEVDLSAQIKLLRILQTHKFERLGGNKSIDIDVRILAATNKDLLEEVKAGRFREDLYYRLDVVPLNLPPLRERGNDIAILARHFLGRFAAEQGKQISDISASAMRALLEYSWPGNIRELENVMEQAAVLCKSEFISLDDLPIKLQQKQKTTSRRNIKDQEKNLLLEALEACGWNKKMAAEHLGIGRSTLYAKMKKHGIQKDS